MLKPIAIFYSMFFCANLYGANFYEACAHGVEVHNQKKQESMFELELREKTILPQTVLQAFSNNLFIYNALEKKLERRGNNWPFVNSASFRREAVLDDILFISSVFEIQIPPPTRSAQNLANVFGDLNGAELLAAFYVFHAPLLSDSPRIEYFKSWFSRHGKGIWDLKFYTFDSLPQSKEDSLLLIRSHFSSVEVNSSDFDVYSHVTEILLNLILDVEKSVYSSEYVLAATKGSQYSSSYKAEIEKFYKTLPKSKL